MRSSTIPVAALACLLAPSLEAQWTANLAVNTAVADLANDQAVPKVSARPDGGCYVGWFDHSGPNYDLRLQRLDQNGYEAWPHNGIVVSSNPQNSSLVDWDLITDYNGDAVIVFTDIRGGGDLDVYGYLVDANANFLWGANGIPISADTEYEANPVVAELSDGTFLVAWNRNITGSTSVLEVQKYDLLGNALLGSGIQISGSGSDDPGFVGVIPTPFAGFILTWIRDTVPVNSSAKHVWSQSFDANGNPLWGPTPRIVYDGASLPPAYKPEAVPDGSGGAWYAWYASTGPYFQGFVQHVDVNGMEVFAHNGVEISLEPARSELYPTIVPFNGDLLVFYNKRNSSQSAWGIGGQRISAAGGLLWGANGLEYVPYDATAEEAPRAIPAPNGAMCFVEQGNFGTTIVGFRVDGNGVSQWTPSPHPVCTLVSGKDKVRAVAASDGTAIVVWNDARLDSNNVYAQNVELDGSSGIPPALAAPYGCGWNPPGSLAVLSGTPAIGTPFTVGITDPNGSMATGSLPLLAISALPAPGFPCGLLAGNVGMPSPGSVGELLVDLGLLVVPVLSGSPWTAPAVPVPFPFAIPNLPPVVGVTLYLQGALFETGTGRVGLTNGLSVRLGP